MTVSVRPWAEIAADLRDPMKWNGTTLREAAVAGDALAAEVDRVKAETQTRIDSAVEKVCIRFNMYRPDCPRCGGTGKIHKQAKLTERTEWTCPDCDHGKVTVEQLAATWQAVHNPDDTTRHMHDAFSLLEQLRSVRP